MPIKNSGSDHDAPAGFDSSAPACRLTRRYFLQSTGAPAGSPLLSLADGSATAKTIDYSLERWGPLTHYLADRAVPIDNNNWVENHIQPIAIGRNNWLFAGSLCSDQRAAAVMSLIHSARLNGHDVNAYLKDILEHLPTQAASRIGELLPHRWKPSR